MKIYFNETRYTIVVNLLNGGGGVYEDRMMITITNCPLYKSPNKLDVATIINN